MLLDIRNLTKTYGAPDGGDAVNVLRGVDLKMQAGETLSVTGPSGSGKSTVLNIIGALDKADSGEVIVNGQNVEKLGKDALAAYRSTTVGFIFQLHHLLPQCTILENVLVPTLAEEADLPWRGNVELTDCESGSVRRQRIDEALAARYRAAYGRHFALWREACRKRGLLFARVPAEGTLAHVLGGEAFAAGAIEPTA